MSQKPLGPQQKGLENPLPDWSGSRPKGYSCCSLVGTSISCSIWFNLIPCIIYWTVRFKCWAMRILEPQDGCCGEGSAAVWQLLTAPDSSWWKINERIKTHQDQVCHKIEWLQTKILPRYCPCEKRFNVQSWFRRTSTTAVFNCKKLPDLRVAMELQFRFRVNGQ